MRRVLLIILLGIFGTSTYAQKKTSITDVRNIYDEKGDYYSDRKEYKKAIVYFNMAYQKDAKNYYSVLRKAETYKALQLYDQAAECYRIIFATNLYIPNEHRLNFALLLLKNKDVKGFEEWIGKYNEIVNSEISGYIGSSEARAKMYKDSLLVLVENESVLNTPESEIAPSLVNGKVVFSSDRSNLMGNNAKDNFTFYTASYLGDGRLGRLNIFNSSINSSKNESGAVSANNTLYFTRSSSKAEALKTFTSNVPSSTAAKLSAKDFTIGGMSSIGHLSFNSNGTKVFFVSEASGGQGGTDIYSSELIGGKWSEPVNLGASINTPKDELYPHVVNDTTLYFTSAGHSGQGGLDLFVVSLKQENAAIKNLGSKVNTSYDDYGLSFSPDGLTGYFCSNRPGGFGKEDIYRIHHIDLKVKYAAYKFKRKTTIEDDKIHLYVTNGDEYNIASEDKSGFNFGFQPEEAYKMVIRHENVLASDVIYNTKLTADQKENLLLKPKPINKTDIPLQEGMRYQFAAGLNPLSNTYKNSLDEMSKKYQNSDNTIDLTALAKELELKKGEVYTIWFMKDKDQVSEGKSKEVTSLFMNNETVPVNGEAFFIVLPLDVQTNFNIKTDIEHFQDNFSPKKVGKVSVDAEPVYKEEQVQIREGFPILVNTKNLNEVSKRKIEAKELTIVPGTVYILSVSKKDPSTGEELEIIVPLTKGVKYNLGTDAVSQDAYMKAVSQMSAQSASNNDGELIDISILSNELDISPSDDITFNLIPAVKLASQTTGYKNVLTTLNVDGRKYFVTNQHRLQVNLKLDQSKKMSIQTDLAYVKENFETSTIALDVDTTSLNKKLDNVDKSLITDPVYDIITVNFDLNDYAVRPDAKVILADKVIQALKSDKRLYVTIKGYTDALGDADYNKKLSQNRAQSVKDFLQRNGIGENRIRTFSFGESLALSEGVDWEDLSEEELEKHRKVEIIIYLPE